MTEIIFLLETATEGGFNARALGESIFTEGEALEDLRTNIRDAVDCHFEAAEKPKMLMNDRVVTSSKEIMGGTPVFAGTRVPIQMLIDYLSGGDSIDDFLEGFPTVKREQVIEFLKQAEAQMEKIAA